MLMDYEMVFKVLDRVLGDAKQEIVAFFGTTTIEYLGNKEDYTGKGQREVYRIERRVE